MPAAGSILKKKKKKKEDPNKEIKQNQSLSAEPQRAKTKALFADTSE
jgi:hypothetical protein